MNDDLIKFFIKNFKDCPGSSYEGMQKRRTPLIRFLYIE
jgi:hypothetical protein